MKHNWENYFDISSEYWKKVERIYEESEHFPKIVVKERNLHHKFPRSFSKKDGVDVDNDDDNLVSLSLSDHFLVHYYLWKCSKKGYRGMMALAFSFMRKKLVKYASEETIEMMARDYENVMKDAAKVHKGKPKSDEHKKKISEAKKGKTLSDEHKEKLSKAHKGKKHTEESKKKMSKAKKGKTLSDEHKEKLSKAHKGKQLSEETKKKMSEAKKNISDETRKKIGAAQKGKQLTDETKKKMSEAKKNMSDETRKKMSEAQKGKKHSEEAKRKISAAKKGLHWYNNNITEIRAKECPPSYVPGRLRK